MRIDSAGATTFTGDIVATNLTNSRISSFNWNTVGLKPGLYGIEGNGTTGAPGLSYSCLIHLQNSTDVGFQIAGGYVNDRMVFRGASAAQVGTWRNWYEVISNKGGQTINGALTVTGAVTIGGASALTNNGNLFHGNVNFNGVLTGGSGFTGSRVSTGYFRITHNFGTTAYTTQATTYTSGGLYHAVVVTKATNYVDIRMYDNAGSVQNVDFEFIIIRT